MAVVAPVMVSDLTCLEVLGLKPAQFREFVREHGVPHCKISRRTCARLDRFLEVIDRLSGAKSRPHWNRDEAVARIARGAR